MDWAVVDSSQFWAHVIRPSLIHRSSQLKLHIWSVIKMWGNSRRLQPKKLDDPVRFHQSEGEVKRHLSIARWTYRWGVKCRHIQHVWHILQVIIVTVDAESWIDHTDAQIWKVKVHLDGVDGCYLKLISKCLHACGHINGFKGPILYRIHLTSVSHQ